VEHHKSAADWLKRTDKVTRNYYKEHMEVTGMHPYPVKERADTSRSGVSEHSVRTQHPVEIAGIE
jgi:hypothetical protein